MNNKLREVDRVMLETLRQVCSYMIESDGNGAGYWQQKDEQLAALLTEQPEQDVGLREAVRQLNERGECMGCGGSGYTSAPCPDDVPASMRPIGVSPCFLCHGTGLAPEPVEQITPAQLAGRMEAGERFELASPQPDGPGEDSPINCKHPRMDREGDNCDVCGLYYIDVLPDLLEQRDTLQAALRGTETERDDAVVSYVASQEKLAKLLKARREHSFAVASKGCAGWDGMVQHKLNVLLQLIDELEGGE